MKTWSAAFCGLEGCDDIITIFQPLKAEVTFSTQHLFLFIMPAHHSRPVPFSQPAEGWHRWSARSDNGKILANLLQAEATRDRVGLMAALDVQIAYPQFQAYSPASFSKNLSRMKGDLGLRAAAAGGAPGAATHPGAVPIPSAVPSAMPPAAICWRVWRYFSCSCPFSSHQPFRSLRRRARQFYPPFPPAAYIDKVHQQGGIQGSKIPNPQPVGREPKLDS